MAIDTLYKKTLAQVFKDLQPSAKDAVAKRLRRALAFEHSPIPYERLENPETLDLIFADLGRTFYKLETLKEVLRMIERYSSNRFNIPKETVELKDVCQESIRLHLELINGLMQKKEKRKHEQLLSESPSVSGHVQYAR